MKRISASLLLIIIILSGCQKTYQKPIDDIYIYHSEFGQRFLEYKVDLRNKSFWEFNAQAGSNFLVRDSSASNEGYTFVCNLTDEKISAFNRESARYGFTWWNDNYENNYVMDGHQWGITITFSDSTIKTISGSNRYPKTWDKMYDVFEDLAGENLFLLKSDWLKKQ
jgi:hypothetical protein